MKKKAGFSLMELVFAVVLTSLMIFLAAETLSRSIKYFRTSSVRNQLENDGRNCLATMIRFLQEGRASSTVISTPATTPASPPYSQIDFVLAADSSTHYSFYYQNATVQMKVTKGAQVIGPRTLAEHVTTLNFMGDSTDPAIVLVNLRLDQPAGSNVESVIYPNQTVHMVTAPSGSFASATPPPPPP